MSNAPQTSVVYTSDGTGRTLAELRRALGAAGFEVGAARPVRRTVLDTFDGRFHDAGLRLEHREDGQQAIVIIDERSTAHVPVAAPPRLADDLAPGPLRARVGAVADVRALLPLSSVHGRAMPVRRRNGDGKVVAAATIYADPRGDDGPLTDSWVVEVVPLTGYSKGATRLADVLEALGLHATRGDLVDFAGLRQAPGAAVSSATIPLDGSAAAIDGYRAVLRHLLATIEVNLPGTIDDVDPEFLHDVRVAVRRTRSVLSNARQVLPADVWSTAREAFSWLGSITGDARDLDVYQLEWPAYVRSLPREAEAALEQVRNHLTEQREQAHERLSTELRSQRTAELLADWRAWLDEPIDPSAAGPDATAPMAEVIERRVRRAQRRVLTAGRAIDDSSPATAVHELRKDAKRVRYLLECFGGLYDAAARKAFVQRLKGLQDNLGTHQDADVHVAHLRRVTAELAGQVPVETMLAAGQLVEQLERRRAAMRDEFAIRFGAYDRKATRRALRQLFATAP